MDLPHGRWIEIPTAARLLGVSPRTVIRLLRAGALPGYRFGRCFRIRARDFAAFVQAARVRPDWS